MNIKSIDKKALFLAALKGLFLIILFCFVFFKAILDAIVFFLCCCEGGEQSSSSGPYHNLTTGELDAEKYHDGIYRD